MVPLYFIFLPQILNPRSSDVAAPPPKSNHALANMRIPLPPNPFPFLPALSPRLQAAFAINAIPSPPPVCALHPHQYEYTLSLQVTNAKGEVVDHADTKMKLTDYLEENGCCPYLPHLPHHPYLSFCPFSLRLRLSRLAGWRRKGSILCCREPSHSIDKATTPNNQARSTRTFSWTTSTMPSPTLPRGRRYPSEARSMVGLDCRTHGLYLLPKSNAH